MHSARHRATGYLAAFFFCLALGVLAGCGSDDRASTSNGDEPPARRISTTEDLIPAEVAAREYMKRKYSDEPWYPRITGIYISLGAKVGASTVTTTLYGHKHAKRNRRLAEEICRAVISTPQIKTAGVFYDDRRGGSTAACP